MKLFFQKVLAFLRIRATAAGLEIGDRVVRLVLFDGKVWQMHAVRLEAGVVDSGRIRDRAAFIAALTALKLKVGGTKNKRANVVVCMSSVPVYTQVFDLPVMQGQSFGEAVSLNLQMASPLDPGESHSGWQIVGRDEMTMRSEVLSAFVERKVVDEMIEVLFEAGFIAMALESRALALTRVLRSKGAGVDPAKPYLMIDIDNSGMDFLVIRNGALYFEYATQWRDIMDDKGEIPTGRFESALAGSLRQVLNFYNQHWKEPLASVILSAVALEAQAEKAMAENSPLPVSKLTLVMGQPISSEWLVALGCCLRGMDGGTAADKEINLLGEDSRSRFEEEQLLHFMRFWRVMLPLSLAILVLTFAGADLFVSSTRIGIESRANLAIPGEEAAQISSLQNQAQNFNREVALVTAAEAMRSAKGPFVDAVLKISAANGITPLHIVLSSFGTPVSFIGSATNESAIVAFKGALTADPRFSSVNLPLTGVQTQGNTITFSMTFVFTPAAPPAS